jgi:hypothetical protein
MCREENMFSHKKHYFLLISLAIIINFVNLNDKDIFESRVNTNKLTCLGNGDRVTRPDASVKGNNIRCTSQELENIIKRNGTLQLISGYALGVSYGEVTIKVRYYANYSIRDSNQTIPEYIINSTRDNDGQLVFEKGKIQSYSLIHFYNVSYPFTSEVYCSWDSENYLNISFEIDLNNVMFVLGKYSFMYEVLDNNDEVVFFRKESFYISDNFEFLPAKTLVFTPMYTSKWSNLSTLNPSEVSPSDRLVLVGHLVRDYDTQIHSFNENISNYLVSIRIGSQVYHQNMTYYNGSNSIHNDVGLTDDPHQIITIIDIPSTPFLGNIEVKYSLEIGIEWTNSTPIEFLTASCPPIEIPCSYYVVSDPIRISNPDIVWFGEFLNFDIPIYPTRIYNGTSRIEPAFTLSDIIVKMFWIKGESDSEEKELQTRVERNNINVGHPGFGLYPLLEPGKYRINITWGDDREIYDMNSLTEAIYFDFLLKEDYKLRLLDNYGHRIDQIFISDIHENLKFRVLLVFKNSEDQRASFFRKFWIGINENNRWLIKKSDDSNQYWFNQSLEIKSNITELWTWVEYSNLSIIKLPDPILIILRDETSSASASSSDSVNLPALGIMVAGMMTIVVIRKSKTLKNMCTVKDNWG